MATEKIVAQVNELSDGQMKKFEIDDDTALLVVRVGDEYRVYGGSCPHHGAPLDEGLLRGGTIRCPWHQAVFDVDTGDLIEPPSLDALEPYETRIDGDNVVATIPDDVATSRTPDMAEPDTDANSRTFVIVGTGAAGLNAAEALRQEGFQGRIVMITREDDPPYDRTDLSKMYLSSRKSDPPFLRCGEFYEKHGIELQTGREVAKVDPSGKTLEFADGESMSYDRLLLATGSVPRTLGTEGEDLDNVLLLRSYRDCEAIRSLAAEGAKAVVVGASFIGMEVAASLTRRKCEVTVVAPNEEPFQRVFDKRIGKMYRQAHEKKGVSFRLGHTVDRYVGDGKLARVVLDDGEEIEADFAVVGVGVRPQVPPIDGVEPNDDGSVTVDAQLRLTDDVWAAGDIARLPDWRTGEPIRIEHWRVAEQLGRLAARNMAGGEDTYRDSPFFWTNQYFVITDYVGLCSKWDEVAYDGDPADQQFVAYYLKDGRVLAAAGCQEEKKMALLGELLAADTPPTLDETRNALSELG